MVTFRQRTEEVVYQGVLFFFLEHETNFGGVFVFVGCFFFEGGGRFGCVFFSEICNIQMLKKYAKNYVFPILFWDV